MTVAKNRKDAVMAGVVMAFALVMLMGFMGGSTYARYAISANGNGSAPVAKWAVKVNGSNSNTFALKFDANNGNSDIVTGKIAPGVTATAYVDVDLSGTEVSVAFDCALTGKNDAFSARIGTPELSEDAANMTLDPTNKIVRVSAAGAMNGSVKVPITITWPDGNEETDTAMGMNSGSMEIPVRLTVRQYISPTA